MHDFEQRTMDVVRAKCAPLIARAKAEGKMLFLPGYGRWFTPDGLSIQQEGGSFCWGPQNFALRDPAEWVEEAREKLAEAKCELDERRRDVAELFGLELP